MEKGYPGYGNLFFCGLQQLTGMGTFVGSFAGDMTLTKGFVKGIG